MRRASALLFTLVLFTPLVALPGFGDDGLRLAVVSVLATLLMGSLALAAARQQPVPERHAPLLTAGLILLAAHFLSLFAARSPWEAAPPILILGCGLAVYAFARSGRLSADHAPLAVAILGLVFASWGLRQASYGGEAVSFLGNRNYAGALAAMLLPAAIGVALAPVPSARRALAGLSATALLVLLFLTESRGGLIAAGVGIVVVGVAAGVKRVRAAWVVAGGTLALLVAVPLLLQSEAHLSTDRAGSVTARIEIWKSALRMFADRPWIGVGAGSFDVEYPPYRSKEEATISHEHPPAGWKSGPFFKEVEDAHSSWVQTAVDTGVPGLLAFILVTVVAVRVWQRRLKQADDAGTIAWLAGLGGAAAAYLVAGMFNSLTLRAPHTVLFWALLGLIGPVSAPRRPPGRAGVAFRIAGTLAAGFGAWMALTLALSERAHVLAWTATKITKRADIFHLAAARHPADWKAHYGLGGVYRAMGSWTQAITFYQEAHRLRPYHAGVINDLAIAYVSAGAGDEGETWFRRAEKETPHVYLTHLNLGLLHARRERYAEAREHLLRALDLKENHPTTHFTLGKIHLVQGNAVSAVAYFRRARNLGLDVGSILKREHPTAEKDPALKEFFKPTKE